MESPEKRNANSKDAPICCQAGYSIYFSGWDQWMRGEKTAAATPREWLPDPPGAPQDLQGASGGKGLEEGSPGAGRRCQRPAATGRS